MKNYVLNIRGTSQFYFENIIQLFNYLNDNSIYNYKSIIIKDKCSTNIKLIDLFNNDELIFYILNKNIKISFNLYFILINICTNSTKKEYIDLLNEIISFDYFLDVFNKMSNFNLIKESYVEAIFSIEQINILERLIYNTQVNLQSLNKFYQLFITFLLENNIKSLDKNKLIKSYNFNSVFLNRNAKYFDKYLISLYQKNKSKEIKSIKNIIKEEVLSYIEFKDIDINVFDYYLKYIDSNYISQLTKDRGFEIYYCKLTSVNKANSIIDIINDGKINLDELNFHESLLNKYVFSDLNIWKEHKIKNINANTEIIPLYGLYGSYDIKNVYNKKFIVRNTIINNQTLFTIIKPISKNNKLINLILFIIIDINSHLNI